MSVSERNCNSLSKFKSYIQRKSDTAPPHFSFGLRKLNIIHTKLRHRRSQLNYDLFRLNIITDPSCHCGNPCENAFHYLLECSSYKTNRDLLLNELRKCIQDKAVVNLDLLLNGNTGLSVTENQCIFKHVQHFISPSKRFQ